MASTDASSSPPKDTKVKVRYLGSSHVFEDGTYGSFVAGGKAVEVAANDVERLQSTSPYDQFEVVS